LLEHVTAALIDADFLLVATPASPVACFSFLLLLAALVADEVH
jgi:hypothetical protein